MGISKEVLLIQTEVPDMDLCSEFTNTSHMHEQTPSMNEGLATSHIQSPDLDLDAWTTPYGQSMLAPEAAFYPKLPQQCQHTKRPPSRAVLALMPRNKRIQQDTTTGLFSWPRECREALYIAVLHPYCGLPQLPRALDSQRKCHFAFNHKKATKLMVLCSQVWEEAIEIIHLIENMLLAAGGKGPIFRHGKDFGKPGFFQTDRRTTRLHIPPILSEGQILRMRKIAIQINYPSHQNWLLRTGAARSSIPMSKGFVSNFLPYSTLCRKVTALIRYVSYCIVTWRMKAGLKMMDMNCSSSSIRSCEDCSSLLSIWHMRGASELEPSRDTGIHIGPNTMVITLNQSLRNLLSLGLIMLPFHLR